MRKVLFAVISIIVFTLSACKDDGQKAVVFNNRLVLLENSLSTDMNMANMKNKINIDTASINKVLRSVKQKTEEINKMSVPSGGDDFKKVMIEEFEAVHNMYSLYLKMADPKITEAEINNLEKQIDAIDIDKYENKVSEEQKKFAKKHNIQLY